MSDSKKKDIPKRRLLCNIDWDRVKGQLLTRERISAGGAGASKAELLKAADECLRVARYLVKPVAVFTIKDISEIKENKVGFVGPLFLSGSSLSLNVRGSRYAGLFLVTIGADVEETATMLMENGEQLHGYLLDRIGSFAVESLAEGLEDRLRREYTRRDMSVSMRFSPGYCDWAIEEQFKLDKLIDFSRAGVRLTQSCMMIPRKSISGLVGIGPRGLFGGSKSQCDICNRSHCDYKRVATSGRDN